MAELPNLVDVGSLQNETSALTAINANSAAISAAFLDVLSRTDVAPNQMEAVLDMNSNRIINLPSPISTSEPVTLAYMNEYLTTGQGVTGLTGVPVSAAMQPVVAASTIGAAQTLLGIKAPLGFGAVTMFPTVGSTGGTPWSVYDPYGNAVSTAGTTTCGLQEAINYSIFNGYPLNVYGHGVENVSVQTGTLNGNNIITGLSSTAAIAAAISLGVGNVYVTTPGPNPSIPNFTNVVSVDSASQVTISSSATTTGTTTLRFVNSPAFISCSTPITVPAVEQWSAQFYDVNITFSSGVSGANFVFDSCLIVDVSFYGGQIVCQNNNHSVLWAPTNPVPADGIITVSGCKFYFSNIVSSGGAVFAFNCSVGGVTANSFGSVELNGSEIAGTTGILVFGSGPTTGFEGNILDISNIHGCQTGVQIGVNTSNTASLFGNVYTIGNIGSSTASGSGLSTFGNSDIFNVGSIGVESGTLNQAVNFQSSSNGNNVTIGFIQGATTNFVNAGTNNLVTYNGNIYKNGTPLT